MTTEVKNHVKLNCDDESQYHDDQRERERERDRESETERETERERERLLPGKMCILLRLGLE